MKIFVKLQDCPVGAMKLCVTSPAEMLKCNRMKTALDAQLINPKMTCVRSEHATGCMKNIASLSGNAGKDFDGKNSYILIL